MSNNQLDLKYSTNKVHFFGLDLLKLIAFIMLAGWHYVAVIWVDTYEYFHFSATNELWAAIEFWSRSLCQSGQIILMISAFLTGLNGGKARSKWFYVFLIFGLLAFSLMEKKDPEEAFLEWDVYALVFVGFLFHRFILKLKKVELLVLIIVSFFLTWVPYKDIGWLNSLPKLVRQFLIGDCVHASAQWPILPWLLFLLLFMAMGRLFRIDRDGQPFQTGIKTWMLMGVGLTISFLNYNTQFQYHSNEFTNCELFLVPPLDFWLQYIPVLILGALCFDERVNNWLGQHFAYVKRMHISKNLWLLYFMQYLVIHIFSWTAGDWLRSGPVENFIGYILVWPVSELASAFVLRILSKLQSLKN